MRKLLIACVLLWVAIPIALATPKQARKPKPRADTAIIKLQKQHSADPSSQAKLEKVWEIPLLRQNSWFFIWRPDDGDGHPRIATVNGQNYVQCYSDRAQAVEEAALAGLDASVVRAVPIAKAVRLLAALDGEDLHESVWDARLVAPPMTMPLRNYPDIYTVILKKKLPE